MPGSASRPRIATRTARPEDLPAVLDLVRQHRADAHAEGVLTGQSGGRGAGAAAAVDGFRRLLADPRHRVVLAVPATAEGEVQYGGEDEGKGESEAEAVGLVVLGIDALSVVLGVPQVTVDNLVVRRGYRRQGIGAALLAAAAEYAAQTGADHVVAAVGGHEAERLRFLARMGFAPLTTRRIVPRETLTRSLAEWRRGRRAVPAPRPVPSLGRR